MCDKRPFDTRQAASEVIYYLKRSSSRDKIPRRTYFCRYCSAWHLTSETKGEYRARRKWQKGRDKPSRTMRDRRK
ncbi:hypothetical protein [Fibrella forsythiae]|uniref:50S ribosomal protein L44e n=1 Tax=Fibrella forsythiae TaxID=2817061 RepID=A0ABS3JF47_9BACT|nr:hypothetical protein [Fibrella forsythiae]MBO0947537.1 hypothetical protein [Fibrella forsythiae]